MIPQESMGEKLRRLVPFGLLVAGKPRHYREMAKIAWRNKDEAAYAMRILQHGVCDGCSLGPRGLKDDVMPGTHLCITRLNLLRLNTMPAMREGAWADVATLRRLSNAELQDLGRVPYPLMRKRGESGFVRIPWDEALDEIARHLNATTPDRLGFFVTSRGITNETYYAAQKLPRALGTNNVDLCARLCHSPSVVALKSMIGWGAPTCSLSDLIGTDLVVLVGTNAANNQPVMTKYLHYAKKQGTKVVVVNPYREPGLERYWIPSLPWSAMFGTRLMDHFFQVAVGGDTAFFTGALKALIEKGLVDRAFVEKQTTSWSELEAHARAQEWEDLERSSGLARSDMEAFAEIYGAAKTAVIVWSMGITQHACGTENVRAIANLGLARGMIGRPKTGLVPIRGHSGVQGGGEIGVDPGTFPGGDRVDEKTAARLSLLWGLPVPAEPGMHASEMMHAAHEGKLDALYTIGGNLLETMPDPQFVREALAKLKLRVHQDIVLNTGALLDGETVIVLPAATRYEQAGGGTSTSTERRIRFSPEIPGRRIGEARSEWEILRDLGERVVGRKFFDWPDGNAVRAEMAQAMPMYRGIEGLAKEGDSVQWGGALLGAEGFPRMPGGKARFAVVPVPANEIPDGKLRLATRRGKQFNSMVHAKRDPFSHGAGRNAVLIAKAEAAALGLRKGDAIVVRSEDGEYRGVVRYGDLPRRHVQVFWPEANVLLPRDAWDEESGIPDYNAFVTVEKA